MGPGEFGYEFRERIKPLVRVMERWRDRAEKRRGVEWSRRWQAGQSELENGDERPWRELRDAYVEAINFLRRAKNTVYGARVLLDKINGASGRSAWRN